MLRFLTNREPAPESAGGCKVCPLAYCHGYAAITSQRAQTCPSVRQAGGICPGSSPCCALLSDAPCYRTRTSVGSSCVHVIMRDLADRSHYQQLRMTCHGLWLKTRQRPSCALRATRNVLQDLLVTITGQFWTQTAELCARVGQCWAQDIDRSQDCTPFLHSNAPCVAHSAQCALSTLAIALQSLHTGHCAICTRPTLHTSRIVHFGQGGAARPCFAATPQPNEQPKLQKRGRG